MTTDRGALAALLATMTMLASASPALAQTEQTAPVRGLEGLANPAPQTNATVPIPDAPKIVLPTETPTPQRTPSPRPTDKPATEKTNAAKTNAAKTERPAARNEPETRTRNATDAARSSTSAESARVAEPAPVATPAPEPTVAPPPTEAPVTDAAPQPAPQTVPDATPAPTSQPTIAAPETGRAMPLWLSLAVIVVVLAALWVLRRKPRGRRQDQMELETVAEPTPEPAAPEPVARPAAAAATPVEPKATPAAPAVAAVPATAIAAPKFLEPRAKTPPPPPAAPRARVTCDLRPLRAGLNLLSATVECELVVTNAGTAPAEAVRTGVALLTAHAGQDTDLARFNAAPIGRPTTPPFALAPGESRTIRTVVAIARDAIQTMTAADRPMFVPVVATNILYATAGDDAQTARAWVVGIERVDSAKLAPFWLDAPARMFTTVAVRPHGAEFER
ncbi:hypothetical protein [Sphingomonas albertensis]|uniref:Uncharacterized protein n=1 Tax=Sphingomonas albertensis TaxID=2762591 RepID=A0ABR7ARK6_9SPHN|nr:hypothetical protein [Sphingomonas albertensis]MBC3943053.1 hypothetical protein [Sphingomonas albertensis]